MRQTLQHGIQLFFRRFQIDLDSVMVRGVEWSQKDVEWGEDEMKVFGFGDKYKEGQYQQRVQTLCAGRVGVAFNPGAACSSSTGCLGSLLGPGSGCLGRAKIWIFCSAFAGCCGVAQSAEC